MQRPMAMHRVMGEAATSQANAVGIVERSPLQRNRSRMAAGRTCLPISQCSELPRTMQRLMAQQRLMALQRATTPATLSRPLAISNRPPGQRSQQSAARRSQRLISQCSVLAKTMHKLMALHRVMAPRRRASLAVLGQPEVLAMPAHACLCGPRRSWSGSHTAQSCACRIS